MANVSKLIFGATIVAVNVAQYASQIRQFLFLSEPAIGAAVTNYATKIEWFGTARVRIGYVWGDGNVMSYHTGGWPAARSI